MRVVECSCTEAKASSSEKPNHRMKKCEGAGAAVLALQTKHRNNAPILQVPPQSPKTGIRHRFLAVPRVTVQPLLVQQPRDALPHAADRVGELLPLRNSP